MSTDAFEVAEHRVFARYGIAPGARRLALADPALSVRVLESGDGPPLLLLPGDGAVAVAWAPLVAELPDRRTIVLDRPGFGRSDRFDYRGADLRAHAVALLGSLLDALGERSLSIVGSSGGAEWALWFAAAAPERVDRLVVMGAPAVSLPGYRPPAPMRLNSLPGVGRVLFALPSPSAATTGKLLSRTDARLLDHPEIVGAYHAAMRLPGYGAASAAVFRRSFRVGGAARPELVLTDAELAGITAPTLFVWGEQEPFATPETPHRAAAHMPDARVAVVPGAWHHPWLADPPGVAALVRAHLDAGAR